MRLRVVVIALAAAAVGTTCVAIVSSCLSAGAAESVHAGVVLDAESENLDPDEIAKWSAEFEKLPLHRVDPSNEFLSVETQERMAAIDREIARSVVWRDRHADELIELIHSMPDAHGVKPPPDDPPELRSKRALALKAMGTVRGRFSIGAPVEPAVEDKLVEVLLEYTTHEESNTRYVAVDALLESVGILERPEVIARIREIRRTDPEHPIVRRIRQREFELKESGWDGNL